MSPRGSGERICRESLILAVFACAWRLELDRRYVFQDYEARDRSAIVNRYVRRKVLSSFLRIRDRRNINIIRVIDRISCATASDNDEWLKSLRFSKFSNLRPCHGRRNAQP